jgi:hypothetical protein
MRNFNDNDDEFNDGEFGDDFFGRWEEFHRKMNNEKASRDMDRFRRDLEELMKLLASKEGGTPFRFQFLPLTGENRNDLNIPEGEMNIESGEDANGKWETKEWTSPNGEISFMSFSRSSSSEDDVNSPDEMMEGWKSRLADRGSKRVSPEEIKRVKLAKLQRTLDYLVEQEKYEKAAEIKKMIDELNNPPAATEGENKA